MDFSFTEEQRFFREQVRGFLKRECPSDVLRAAEASPARWSPALWRQMAAMDLIGLGLPEAAGGSPASHLDLAIVAEELGAALAPVPFLETAFATRLIAGAALAELLPAVVAGERVIVPAAEGEWVSYGAAADAFVGIRPEGLALFEAGECEREPVETIDGGPHAMVRLSGDGRRLAGLEALAPARATATALAAAMMAGGARATVELAVAYAKTRVQFERPIGSFQAIQHKAADMAIAADAASLLAYEAAWALDGGDAGSVVPMAAGIAAEAFRSCTAAGEQVMGGYGFVLEEDMQLFFRRAKGLQLAWGSWAEQAEPIARALLGPASESRA